MNCDGLALLERIEKEADPELLKRIDRCFYFVKSRREYETILFRTLMAKDKVYAETLTVHLLSRLLENLT